MIFSVIIPFLNEEEYIESCVGSLLSQDFNKQEYELIFVDNGSQDRSSGILRKFPGLTLLHEGRKNEYIARNTAVKIAKGQIMAFIDADCLAGRSWLTQIYQGMIKYDADIALGRVSFPGDNLFLKTLGDYENSKLEYVVNSREKRYYFASANNMAVKTGVFKKIGFFSEDHLAGDTEFIQRYISSEETASAVAYLPQMRIIHMEIKNVRTWLKKINKYAKINRLLENDTDYVCLSCITRLKIFGHCLKANRYRFDRMLILFFLLILGNFFYDAGRLNLSFGDKDYP